MKLVDNFKIGIKDFAEKEMGYGKDVDLAKFIEEYGEKNIKLAFLTNIFGLTTYSKSMDIAFGKDILEIMNVINKHKSFEYIKIREENHKKFIMVANLLENHSWIEWGTSIRGCWFSDWGKPNVTPDLEYYNMKDIVFDSEGNDIQEMLDFIDSEKNIGGCI